VAKAKKSEGRPAEIAKPVSPVPAPAGAEVKAERV
jgi:hypothetical protein